MEMFQKGDESHLKVISKMQEMTQTPSALKEWFDCKEEQFNSL
tara:strand:+ start:89007 stop:89135 length:129 start_codon:yes stop_codon:yes gene_type:complete